MEYGFGSFPTRCASWGWGFPDSMEVFVKWGMATSELEQYRCIASREVVSEFVILCVRK